MCSSLSDGLDHSQIIFLSLPNSAVLKEFLELSFLGNENTYMDEMEY